MTCSDYALLGDKQKFTSGSDPARCTGPALFLVLLSRQFRKGAFCCFLNVSIRNLAEQTRAAWYFYIYQITEIYLI